MPGTGSAMVIAKDHGQTGKIIMPIRGDYMGIMLTIEDVDRENLDFFRYCSKRNFRLQKGKSSGLLRYAPTTACLWTTDGDAEWVFP